MTLVELGSTLVDLASTWGQSGSQSGSIRGRSPGVAPGGPSCGPPAELLADFPGGLPWRTSLLTKAGAPPLAEALADPLGGIRAPTFARRDRESHGPKAEGAAMRSHYRRDDGPCSASAVAADAGARLQRDQSRAVQRTTHARIRQRPFAAALCNISLGAPSCGAEGPRKWAQEWATAQGGRTQREHAGDIEQRIDLKLCMLGVRALMGGPETTTDGPLNSGRQKRARQPQPRLDDPLSKPHPAAKV